MSYLDELNDVQREAVVNTDGPTMIVAGPGSGKTRVLTYRIAHLLNNVADPFSILALTFTNKATEAMRQRIEKIAGTNARNLYMGTFHSVFARILRVDAQKIGYPSNFTIYDTDDSRSLIKTIIKEQGLDDKIYKPNQIQWRISAAKNALITPQQYAEDPELLSEDRDQRRPATANIYMLYCERCFKSGAMDFDDLLLNTHIILEKFPDVLYKYQHKFRYVLIDEFQDTNTLQYAIVKKIADVFQNITVVGDDAQSNYAVRGATIDNILKFEKDFPELKVFKLEQNYRSTQNIVKAANELIHRNKNQLKKEIWTENGKGEPIKIVRTPSDNEEGRWVADSIMELKMRDHVKNSGIAILYRTNAQSRAFEEALRRYNIPYKIYGGMSFYQRKEIKDMLAYLRLIVNPTDEEALRRIINYPTRGIGKTTLDRLYAWAGERNESIWSLLSAMADLPTPPAGMNKVVDFVYMIRGFQTMSSREDAYQVAQHVSKHTGLHRLMVEDKSVEGISRMQNLEELLNAIREYTEEEEVDPTTGAVDSRDHSLAGFLQHVALLTDADLDGDDENPEKVSLMTIHQAKGLEFNQVYVTGMEESLFPSSMRMESRADLEEERRLFYVGITRAEKRLTLTYAQTRFRHGNFLYPEPSRFLPELDPSCLELRKGIQGSGQPGFSGYSTGYGGSSRSTHSSRSSGSLGSTGTSGQSPYRPSSPYQQKNSGHSSQNGAGSNYRESTGSPYGKPVHRPLRNRRPPPIPMPQIPFTSNP